MKIKRNKDIKELKLLFENSIKEIESQTKRISLNNLKIKENFQSIKKNENQNNILSEMVSDKKVELNILKQLLILKEKKKLNFDAIISNYLNKLIFLDNKTNNKIDLLKDKNFIIDKKQKVIKLLLKNVNKEFNNYLQDNNINDEKTKEDNKKKDISPKHKQELSFNIPTTINLNKSPKKHHDFFKDKYNLKNYYIKSISNTTKNEHCKKFTEYEFKGEFEDIKGKKEKFKLSVDKNKVNEKSIISTTTKHDKNNSNFIGKENKIFFEANKNLIKPRENLRNLFSQNDKEKNIKKKEYLFGFSKVLIKDIKAYLKNNYKFFISQIKIKLISISKARIYELANKKIYQELTKIKNALKEISIIYNKNKDEEIINDEEFLQEIESSKNLFNSNPKYNLDTYRNSLMNLKNINNQIKELEIKICEFATKIN